MFYEGHCYFFCIGKASFFPRSIQPEDDGHIVCRVVWKQEPIPAISMVMSLQKRRKWDLVRNSEFAPKRKRICFFRGLFICFLRLFLSQHNYANEAGNLAIGMKAELELF